MPSIESLYLQNEKAVDKCTVNFHETSLEDTAINIGSDILDEKVKEMDKKMESLKGAVEVDELQGPGYSDIVVIKIEDTSHRKREEEEEEVDIKECGPKNEEEESKDEVPEKVKVVKTNGTDTSKPTNEKWDDIWAKFCPGFNQTRNKLLKAKLSAVFSKSVFKSVSKSVSKDDELCKQMGSVSIGGDKNGLTSKGPGQTSYHNAEMSPQYSPAYSQLTSMSSPPHDTSVLPTITMLQNDLKNTSGVRDVYQWPSNINTYYAVSPPNNSSYQSDHSISDAEYNMNHVSPPSPDDGPQDIPTVMAQAMYSIVPGEYRPTANNQHLVNTWNSLSSSSMTSQVTRLDCDGRTDYDVQSWPGVDSPSPASFCGNPPSVSSNSDVDSVFGSPSPYNQVMSPASASSGSAVQSPAPTPPTSTHLHPPQTSVPVPSDSYMTITSSSNGNFGHVQVQRTSNSCSSPPQLYREASPDQQIKDIEEYLKMPDMEPQVPQQQSLPPIRSILPTSQAHSCKAPSMRPSNNHVGPYPRPRNPSSPKSYTTIVSPTANSHLITLSKDMPLQYIPPREVMSMQNRCPPAYEHSIHQKNALRLSPEELLQRDCSDPYEGENILQKLILNQMSDQAIAVVERMVQLGLDLDASNDQGQSSLLLAVINDMPRVVRCLVLYNADVLNGDKKGTYPIHYAASHGFTDVTAAICSSRQHINLDCLDFNGKTPLMCAVEAHRTKQTIYQDGEEVPKLVNNEVIAQLLIENGAQPTKQDARSGKTALHYAISDVKLDMLKIILEGDEMVKVARVPMSDGNTPLHLAVALKCEQGVKCNIIRYLVHKGADISATNVERVKPLDLVTDGHKEVKDCLEQYSKSKRR